MCFQWIKVRLPPRVAHQTLLVILESVKQLVLGIEERRAHDVKPFPLQSSPVQPCTTGDKALSIGHPQMVLIVMHIALKVGVRQLFTLYTEEHRTTKHKKHKTLVSQSNSLA